MSTKEDKAKAHADLVKRALESHPLMRRRYQRDPELRKLWDDPDTDWETEHRATLGPQETVDYIGDESEAMDMLIGNIEGELRIAWGRILDDLRKGVSMDAAVLKWGIRGHPDFAKWFPETPGPWGDEVFYYQIKAQQEKDKNQK